MIGHKQIVISIIIVLACSINYCVTEDRLRDERRELPREYNFKFIGYDENIVDPESDKRAFYKIYIDKLESGRTTIGLESQMKTFQSTISYNRHLLVVEKWILDLKKMKYVKLNNIDQPKPNYLYFNLPPDRVAVITLKNDIETRRASFEIELQ